MVKCSKRLIVIGMVMLMHTPLFAQQAAERRIDQFLCKDVMRESGGDRDVMLAFLHGYLLGRSSAERFNLEQLRRELDAFVERCLDNPGDKAFDAMTQAKATPR